MGFDDERRLAALSDYRVLDSAPEDGFENIVRLAAEIFGTPISLVSFVARDRQWFKARVGLDAAETPRSMSFCDHAIRANETLVVSDAREDPRFSENPLVTGEPHIRFYCGTPLRTPDQQGLGALCIIDRVPRQVSPQELKALEGLARQVEFELELRRRLLLLEQALESQRNEQRSKELLAAMIVHDMRTPLATIALLASSAQPADAASRLDLDALFAEAERMRRMLNDVLDVCLHQLGTLRPRRAAFDVVALASAIVERAGRLGAAAKASITLSAPPSLVLYADPELVGRVLENLITNALQHTREAANITVRFENSHGERVHAEVVDRGSTIPEAERERIFEPMVQGSLSTPFGRGLGLAFCRLAVEAHGGHISAQPNADGPGNRLEFDLPAANRS